MRAGIGEMAEKLGRSVDSCPGALLCRTAEQSSTVQRASALARSVRRVLQANRSKRHIVLPVATVPFAFATDLIAVRAPPTRTALVGLHDGATLFQQAL